MAEKNKSLFDGTQWENPDFEEKDVYSFEGLWTLLEDDEALPSEVAFMEGYNEDG